MLDCVSILIHQQDAMDRSDHITAGQTENLTLDLGDLLQSQFGGPALRTATEARIEAEVARVRGQIAADLHDEIGTALSSILLISTLLGKGNLDDQQKRQLAEITQTAKNTASAMRDVIWSIDADNDMFDALLLKMKQTATTLLKAIPYDFRVSKGPTMRRLRPEVRRNVFLMFKEILNNIVKHSYATEVGIEVTENGETIAISIYDNGRGFDEESVTPGHGLRNLRRRAAENGLDLSIESSVGRGCTVQVSFGAPERALAIAN
jgi:signal transduction histidine kinase